ncbi:MAG TPA: DoxX family protein [Mucilaginibacter sp.]|nr:DoxX family protein [Mucilaginibacter sp.]
MNSLYSLLQTSSDDLYLFLRIVAGVIIFPYGMQKLFGWFDDLGGGVGIKETLAQMKKKKILSGIAWLVIIGQSLGSIALILGFLGRIAAGANFIIFAGALIVHSPDGWAMNWAGRKKGEGIEYFILLLSILLVIIVRGSGPHSIDFWILSKIK